MTGAIDHETSRTFRAVMCQRYYMYTIYRRSDGRVSALLILSNAVCELFTIVLKETSGALDSRYSES